VARFFIGRPIVAIVISIITVTAGLLAMRSLPVAQYPSIIPPQIIVNGTFTGADAVTVEQSVATPLEQQMNGVDDMLYMQSTNANDGTMALTVTFDIDTDPNIDQVNVTNRVSQAQPNLPPDVNQFGLAYRKSTGLPMLVISLFSPHQRYDSLFLANYANININDALYRVRGVGEVRLFGASDYAMRVWLKPDVLAKLGLTVPDLVRAVSQQSTVNPAGRVGADPAPPGKEMTYTVRAQGRLQTAEEFAQIVVRSNPDGSVVRLSDVARIELGALNYQQVSRVNKQPGSIVAVFQAPGSNALDVARGVKSAMAELKQRFPPDLDYVITLDTTLPVTEGISEIAKTILEAMALVTLVVFLFLQNWRATVIPLIAVPVSLIGTFAVFPLLGFSINTLSLFGLVLAIGLVVDDAIVVVEAVEHHIEEGMSPRDATLQAMKEVSGPVVAIALVLSSVFVPIAFVGGIQGRLNTQFAVTIAISVIISAFNALTLSPAVDYGFQGPDFAFRSSQDYWVASLVVSWNLFNGGRDAARWRASSQCSIGSLSGPRRAMSDGAMASSGRRSSASPSSSVSSPSTPWWVASSPRASSRRKTRASSSSTCSCLRLPPWSAPRRLPRRSKASWPRPRGCRPTPPSSASAC